MKSTSLYRDTPEGGSLPRWFWPEPASQPNIMPLATSLHEYRLSYPRTAPIPTITQRGLLGPLLELDRRRATRLARRRAARKQLWSLPAKTVQWLWRALTVPAHGATAESLVVGAPRRV